MSILKREVYFDNTGGIARFWDWAVVTTNIGVMVEPFAVGSPFRGDSSAAEFDPADEIARIDELRALSRNYEPKVLSFDGGLQLNGGVLRPRTGP